MTKYLEQIFPVRCKGRDSQGREVLDAAVDVRVNVHQSPDSDAILSIVECPYNTGGHGQRCKASHPKVDKVGEGAGCPYSFCIPYALEKSREH